MPARSLRQRVLAREPLIGTFLVFGSAAVAEVCARAGFDWLLVDLEHGMASEADLVAHFQALKSTGVAALVRVEQGTRLRVGRVLDLGADGVMIPQVSNPEDAREIVNWLRFQPVGKRGVALFTRGLDYGTGGHGAVGPKNEEVLGILQIESGAAVKAADKIAAVEGVDVLFVGPTDLSHALGIPGQIEHPDYQAAIETVANAAAAHGKAAGVLVWQPEDATRYAKLGYSFFSISSEGSLLERAARAAASATRTSVEAGRAVATAPSPPARRGTS
jgi:2-keto-3-deoxy-L-rhamnonate aldolase RhmA